ncbi:hypothetical protein [Agromyces sp. SYSU T0242]|uniref:hypothetical protein n=1 Tax=Agromyces litoreus TaxID=3158561 RepID=UPI0033964A4B
MTDGPDPERGRDEPARPAPAAAPRVPASAPPTLPAAPGPVAPPGPATPERGYEVPFDTAELHGLPTGQLLTVHRPEPAMPMEDAEEDEQRRVYSRVGAVIGSIGAIASLFVGWMLPLSVAAIVFGVLGLRREEHGRVLAFVGIGTGVTGLVFSGVWLGYYAIVFEALPS